MPLLDAIVSGADDLFADGELHDNVAVLVLDRGSSEEMDVGGIPRLRHVGWWAPLTVVDFFDEGPQIWCGQARFITFDRQIEVVRDIDTSVNWTGIRYWLAPGVEVRFWCQG